MQWQDVLADRSLADLPYKIELNERGKIEMSPASFIHSHLQGEIAYLLRNRLRKHVFTELAIQTRQGVRVPDVAWGSEAYYQAHCGEICASSAPEICVEIASPSNHGDEPMNKVGLFLEAGAREVWLVDESGEIRYFTAAGEQPASAYDIVPVL
jgi:Uma2 family endonuclease